ncbi:MAG: divergent polysaccharide deacetylase family protein [Parvularculaceae bacterium]
MEPGLENMARLRAIRMTRPARAGNAGVIAAVAMAFAGMAVGAISSYLGGRGAEAEEARNAAYREPVKPEEPSETERDRIVARIIAGDFAPERFAPPGHVIHPLAAAPPRPKIMIIIDDMGVDRKSSERAMTLPGPLTFSFLPYAKGVADQAERAKAAGGEIMLHLPMEPNGTEDPGPYALRSGMTGAAFIGALDWNLTRFDGFVGVNNHMGSKLSADPAAMMTILAYLDHKGVFYLDSVTTPNTAARKAAAEVGVKVYARDVFLDDTPDNAGVVKKQLALVEEIAKETGYAVAIGHPHKATLDVLGPWLTTAPARGFDLEFVSSLTKDAAGTKSLAAAPDLRL